ncbi:MAG: RsmD family RNA methyltransferase [Balneolaceae bacterium]
MRIITGTLKGRRIEVPDNLDIRPTSDRTKEGMFSVLAARRYFERLHVLDLFAGSGNLGFEALSRGAETVLFVDNSAEHIRHIEKTAVRFGVDEQCKTAALPVETFLDGTSRLFDLIFCDPPYDHYLIPELPGRILDEGWLEPDGWFLLEHDKRHRFDGHPKCVFSKSYGRTIVSIFQHQPVDF